MSLLHRCTSNDVPSRRPSWAPRSRSLSVARQSASGVLHGGDRTGDVGASHGWKRRDQAVQRAGAGGFTDEVRGNGPATVTGLVGEFEGFGEGEPFGRRTGDRTAVDIPLNHEAGDLKGRSRSTGTRRSPESSSLLPKPHDPHFEGTSRGGRLPRFTAHAVGRERVTHRDPPRRPLHGLHLTPPAHTAVPATGLARPSTPSETSSASSPTAGSVAATTGDGADVDK
jgi:phage tail tape-measure protein